MQSSSFIAAIRLWVNRHRLARAVLIPFLAVCLSVLIAVGVISIAGPRPGPLITFPFLVAILGSAWWGGYRSGVISCLLCYVAVPYLLVPNFAARPFEFTRFGLSIVIALLVSRIAATRAQVESNLRAANEGLEEKVRERTEELAQEKGRYQALANHLMKMQEAERLHLSRELHDSLGQELASLRYSLERLSKRVPEEHADTMQEAVATVGKISVDVRDIASRLRPAILEHLSLPESVEWLLSQWRDRTEMTFTVRIEEDIPEVAEGVKLAVFRMCQEALTNIARHAKASHVAVSLTYGDSLQLRIMDNGVGFDTEQRSRNLGLLGMRERAAGIGGDLEIRSAPGEGTVIQLRLPVARIGAGERML